MGTALFFIHGNNEVITAKELKAFLRSVPDDAVLKLGNSLNNGIRLDNCIPENALYFEEM
jgi:hypothetical protein